MIDQSEFWLVARADEHGHAIVGNRCTLYSTIKEAEEAAIYIGNVQSWTNGIVDPPMYMSIFRVVFGQCVQVSEYQGDRKFKEMTR